MTKQIVISGVNINESYEKLWNERNKTREEASKIIAENIDLAKSLTKTLLVSKDVEEIKKLAVEAYEALRVVDMVSDVSGVHYYLPYSSNYDSYRDIMSYALDDNQNDLLNGLEEVNNLQNLFSELEQQSGQWNNSWC